MLSLKLVNERIEIAPSFFILVTDFTHEHPPTTAFFLCTLLHHRSQRGLFGEQYDGPAK